MVCFCSGRHCSSSLFVFHREIIYRLDKVLLVAAVFSFLFAWWYVDLKFVVNLSWFCFLQLLFDGILFKLWKKRDSLSLPIDFQNGEQNFFSYFYFLIGKDNGCWSSMVKFSLKCRFVEIKWSDRYRSEHDEQLLKIFVVPFTFRVSWESQLGQNIILICHSVIV